MSLENVIVDLTNAVRENTDATNKLILIAEGNTPEVEASPKPDATKVAPKKTSATKEPKSEAPLKKEATEKPKVDEAEEESSSAIYAKKYKHLQSCLIKLSGVYADSYKGKANAKDLGKKDAIAFMKDKAGVIRLDAIKPDQYDEFSQQLELELGE